MNIEIKSIALKKNSEGTVSLRASVASSVTVTSGYLLTRHFLPLWKPDPALRPGFWRTCDARSGVLLTRFSKCLWLAFNLEFYKNQISEILLGNISDCLILYSFMYHPQHTNANRGSWINFLIAYLIFSLLNLFAFLLNHQRVLFGFSLTILLEFLFLRFLTNIILFAKSIIVYMCGIEHDVRSVLNMEPQMLKSWNQWLWSGLSEMVKMEKSKAFLNQGKRW